MLRGATATASAIVCSTLQHRDILQAVDRLYLPMQGTTPGLAAERILDSLILRRGAICA